MLFLVIFTSHSGLASTEMTSSHGETHSSALTVVKEEVELERSTQWLQPEAQSQLESISSAVLLFGSILSFRRSTFSRCKGTLETDTYLIF